MAFHLINYILAMVIPLCKTHGTYSISTMCITRHSYAMMDPASALEFLFKRRRFLAHDLAFFIQRHVSDLIQRVVHIRIVIRIGQRTPVCKEHVHDRHCFAHGIRFANRIRFHVNEVFFVMIVWIRIMLVNGLAGDPRTHEPTRVSERPSRIRAVRVTEFVAAGAMHPYGAPAPLSAFRFQTEPPNGGQRFVKSLAKIRHAIAAEPVPLIEIVGAFAMNVVTGCLHVTAQIALARINEAHVHGWWQNAGTIPVNFILIVQPGINCAMRQPVIPHAMLRDQFAWVAQMQRRVGAMVCCFCCCRWHVQHTNDRIRSIGFSWNLTDGMRHALNSSICLHCLHCFHCLHWFLFVVLFVFVCCNLSRFNFFEYMKFRKNILC